MIFSPTLLAGRTILVTGASSGIGRHTAIALAHSGAKLIITGRDEGRLGQTKSMLQGDVHHAYARSLDDQDDVTEWVKEMALEHSGLDGIFHAAGNALVRPTRMTKAKQVHELLAGSLLAGLGIARAASMKDVMREQGGAIVFMSSVASGRGQSGMAAYSAAKAAIEGMVRSLACEFAPRSIRVNAIAAGAVATKMHDQLMIGLTEAAQSAYESKHLLGFGAPDDIAAVATFLLSDAARWVTGATWLVDGGYSAR